MRPISTLLTPRRRRVWARHLNFEAIGQQRVVDETRAQQERLAEEARLSAIPLTIADIQGRIAELSEQSEKLLAQFEILKQNDYHVSAIFEKSFKMMTSKMRSEDINNYIKNFINYTRRNVNPIERPNILAIQCAAITKTAEQLEIPFKTGEASTILSSFESWVPNLIRPDVVCSDIIWVIGKDVGLAACSLPGFRYMDSIIVYTNFGDIKPVISVFEKMNGDFSREYKDVFEQIKQITWETYGLHVKVENLEEVLKSLREFSDQSKELANYFHINNVDNIFAQGAVKRGDLSAIENSGGRKIIQNLTSMLARKEYEASRQRPVLVT